LAFRLGEELSLPVMVCMDGFILTHAYEPLEVPTQEQVDAFLPSYQPRQVLDPSDPVSIGAMVGPEAFAEVRYLAYAKQLQALEQMPALAKDFAGVFGRSCGSPVNAYRSEDAETIVIALGSVLGTIKDAVDELRDQGMGIGVLGITSFRPFPLDAVRAAVAHARRVVVLEKALAVGVGGILSTNVRMALPGLSPHVYTVIAGLGGRAITKASIATLLVDATADRLKPLMFLDLDWTLVERELQRMRETRRSGPTPENLLRDVGAVAARIA